MVGGGLTAIFFVCTLVCWTIWTGFFVLFASHYVLTTLSDSSSGQDEVHYPNEWFTDWWWKPLLFACVLLPFLVPAAVLLALLIALSIEAYLIALAMTVWLLFPLGLASALYTQHWLHILHFGVIGRMLRHFPAFVYTYLMTLVLCAGAVWMVERALMQSLIWAVPAIVCVPAAILLYARHWGRFAWLSLNYLPSYARKPRGQKSLATQAQPAWPEGDLPAPPVVQARPKAPKNRTSEEGDGIDTDPYAMEDDPEAPSFDEAPAAPASPKSIQAPAAHLMVEEEDEWATDKKPYNFSDADERDALPPDAPPEAAAKSDANKPLVLGQYFDERAKKQKKREQEDEEFKRTLPPLSKKTPSFHAALLAGVWKFLFYGNTLQIWANLVVFMLLELILLYLLKSFWPKG